MVIDLFYHACQIIVKMLIIMVVRMVPYSVIKVWRI